MGDAAGKPAHGFHLLGLPKLLLERTPLLFFPLALGDVTDEDESSATTFEDEWYGGYLSIEGPCHPGAVTFFHEGYGLPFVPHHTCALGHRRTGVRMDDFQVTLTDDLAGAFRAEAWQGRQD